MTAPIRAVALAGLLALVGSACASGIDPNAPDPSDNLTLGIPPTLGGLTVSFSNKATTKLKKEAAKRDTYVRDLSVFELRAGKELKAVFQVMRLTPDARIDNLDFRKTLAAGVGQTGGRAPVNIGGEAVYEYTYNDQKIHVWFEDRFMEVLLVKERSAFSTVTVDVDRLIAEAVTLELRPVDTTTT